MKSFPFASGVGTGEFPHGARPLSAAGRQSCVTAVVAIIGIGCRAFNSQDLSSPRGRDAIDPERIWNLRKEWDHRQRQSLPRMRAGRRYPPSDPGSSYLVLEVGLDVDSAGPKQAVPR